MTSFDPDGGSINDVCIFPDSGLMLFALDNSQIPGYFIPAVELLAEQQVAFLL